MVLVIVPLLAIFLVGLRKQKDKNNYLSRDATVSITGIFVIIIFCSHFLGYIDHSSLNGLDRPLAYFVSMLGQLMVSPFLFFSGYGVFESFKKKGIIYAETMPKNRLLKLFLSFFISWILFASVALFFKSNYSLSDYILSIIGIKTIGNSNWYVVVILLLYSISFLSFWFSNGDKKRAMLIHVLLIPVLYIILAKISSGVWWYNTLFCYLFGVGYSYFKERFDCLLFKHKINGFLFLLISAICFAVFYISNAKIDIIIFGHVLYSLTNLFFCLSLVAFLYLFQIKNKVLLFLGTNCFWIYILQRLPMIVFSHSSLISNNKYVYFVCCLLVTLILAVVINKAFSYVWNIIFLKKGNIDEVTNTKIGIVLSYVTLAFSIVGAFVVTPRMLEMLGDVQYGLRSFATSIATWLTVISSALSASYLRFVNQASQNSVDGEGKINSLYLKVFIVLSVLALTITILGVSACYLLNVSFGNYSDFENRLILSLLLISGINISIQFIGVTFTHYLTYRKEFVIIRGLTLVITFLTFALELVFVFLTKSVVAVSLVTLFLTIVSTSLTIIIAVKNKKMPFSKDSSANNSKLLKAIITFSSFVLLNAIVDQINKQVDITILGFMTNAENVTTYTLSHYFVTYMFSLSVAISSTYAPKVHECVKRNDWEELNNLFISVSKNQLIILLFAVGGFAACGHSFICIWLGNSKESVYYYSLVLLLLNVIPLSCNLGIEVQRAMNKHKFRAVLYIVIALVNVSVSVFLIAILPHTLSVWAAIIGTALSVIIGNIIVLNIYNHYKIGLNMKKYFAIVAKYIVMAIAAVAPAVVISYFLKENFSNVALFLINGSVFTLLFAFEIIVFNPKTAIPLIKRIVGRILN